MVLPNFPGSNVVLVYLVCVFPLQFNDALLGELETVPVMKHIGSEIHQ